MVFCLASLFHGISSNRLKLLGIKIGFANLSHFCQNSFGDNLLFDGMAGTNASFREALIGSADEEQSIFTGYWRSVQHRHGIATLMAED